MVKLEQALVLDPPAELHFKAPFSDVTSYLMLHNPTDRQICFKLKTTAPKTYFVRPNSGIIQPTKTVKVAVMLQSLDFETMDKNKHKFMVQSIFAPDGEVNQDALWREAKPGSFMNSKLKCVFDMDFSDPQVSIDGSGDTVKNIRTAQEEKNEKSQSSASGPSKDNVKAELKKLQDEQAQLRSMMIDLKQENALLKEESLRFRLSCIPDTAAESTEAKAPLPTTQANAAHLQVQNTNQDLFTLYNCSTYILALIIGMLIGHFF